MNTFKFPAFLCSVLALSGCRDYEPENLGISLFMHAYGDNFVAQVGQISPEQSWDFSTAGGHRGQANRTRAVTLDDDVWYYPQDQTLNWMKTELREGADNSSQCQDFFLTWTPGMKFQIVPIYEGKATMDWKLYMKVSSTSGEELFNEEIWSKGVNVQIIGPTLWQFTDNEVSIWFETTSPSVKIWPWNNRTTGEEFTGGVWNSQVEDLKDMTKVGMHGEKYVFKWTSPYDKNSTQGIPDQVIFKPEGAAATQTIDFRNHGYVYHTDLNYRGHDEGHWADGYDSQISRYDGNWRDFEGEDDAALASDFRAKPIEISALSNNTWPLGSIVSFYLKITDNHGLEGCAENNDIMSTLNHQIVYLNVPSENMPTNVDSGDGVVTGILGCEDSSRNGYYFKNQGSGETKEYQREKGGSENNLIYYWGKSDWDYNDVVFLIHGVMPKPVVITNEVSVSTLKKRYMAEDLTDTGDMDFNDIVVDVENVRYTYWNVNESTKERTIATELNESKTVNVNGVEKNLTFKNGICDVQTATVRRLCGTVPIRFQVGNTLLPWVTNPVNAEMSKEQLEGTFSGTKEYGKGNVTTPGNNPDVTLSVTGWDPASNNVVVYVGWDGTEATEPAVNDLSETVSGTNWLAEFPKRGTIPCIIATDVTDPWTAECVDITSTNWWKTNFISTKTTKTLKNK